MNVHIRKERARITPFHEEENKGIRQDAPIRKHIAYGESVRGEIRE